jgi:5'-3' exonuclease
MTTALIDGDIIAYVNAASAEQEDVKYALLRADNQIRMILDYLKAEKYRVFLSGGSNFRYEVNPSYKANRTAPDPIHRQAVHRFLIDEWNAEETEGYEADDALGCNQTDDTIICSLDKDLLMIPGKHYSWPMMRKGVVIRDHRILDVTYEQGIKTFYKQMLIGDTSDNINGVTGLGPAKSSKIIDPIETEKEMYAKVRELYNDDDRFACNLDCLWIWRQLGITFSLRGEHLVGSTT